MTGLQANDRIINCERKSKKGPKDKQRGDSETDRDRGRRRVVGLDFEAELFEGNKDETLLLCFSLPHSFSVSLFLSFGAQGEIMIIRERKSYYCGCSLIM